MKTSLLSLVAVALLTASAHGAGTPNVVIIFTDDMGYGDIVGFTGVPDAPGQPRPKPVERGYATPHFDWRS